MTTTAELAERVFGGILGTYDTWAIYVGDKLGFYREMKDGAPVTAEELARRTAVDSRYAREWLEQQAVSGFVTCDNPTVSANERLYRLDAAGAEVFTDDLSSTFWPPSCAS